MPPKKNKQNNKKKKGPPPKKLNVPAVEWAAQTPAQRVETIKEIKTKFAALDLKNVEIVEATEVQFPAGVAVEHLTAVGCCTEAQGKELAKFENLMDVFDKFEVEMSAICAGVKMPFLVSAFNLESKEQTILEDRRGKLVFMQFWCPWNDRCQRALASVVELAKKHETDWAGKVCFLTVGCDTTLEKLNAKLTEKGWNNVPLVEHLWSGEPPQDEKDTPDDIISKYEIDELPECMVVDAEGRLLRRGDIEDFDPEEYISKRLAGDKSFVEPPRLVEAGTFQALTQDERKACLEKVVEFLQSDPGFRELLLVVSQAKLHPVTINRVDEECACMLVGKVDVRSEKRIAEIVKLVKDSNVKDLAQMVVVTAPSVPLIPAEACYICKTNFVTGDVRWHCAMCVTPVTMCTGCINKDSKAPAAERCDHPSYHPWFRIGGASTQADLEAMVYGMGRFKVAMVTDQDEEKKAQSPQEGENKGESGVVHDDVFCNSCQAGPIADMPRWKCCSCPDFDFCDDCMNKHITNAPAKKAKGKKGKKGGKDTGKDAGKDFTPHDQKHIFLRIDDSELVHLAEDDEDEGDELDDIEEFDEGDLELMEKAMAGEDIDGLDGDDDDGTGPVIEEIPADAADDGTEALTIRIKELSAKGELDSASDSEEHPNEMLNQMAEEAAQVPLPDDDDDVD